MAKTELENLILKDENLVVNHLKEFYSLKRVKEGRWKQEHLFDYLRKAVKIQPLLQNNSRISAMANERLEWLGGQI